jgi:hypothetical protein
LSPALLTLNRTGSPVIETDDPPFGFVAYLERCDHYANQVTAVLKEKRAG